MPPRHRGQALHKYNVVVLAFFSFSVPFVHSLESVDMPFELWERLGELQPHIDLYAGEHGFPFVHAVAPHFKRRAHSCNVHVAKGGSHFWPMEQPAAVARSIFHMLEHPDVQAKSHL